MRFAPAQVELQKRADGSMLLRSPQKLGPYARCVTEWLVRLVRPRARAGLPRRAQRATGPGGSSRYREAYGAVRRIGAGAARPRARRRAPGRDPLRQRHRPCPARARRDARRRAGGADLARLLADVEGLRQAEDHLRAGEAGAGVRRRSAEVRARARRRRREVRRRSRSCSRPIPARRWSASSSRSGPKPSRRSCSPRARPGCPRA